MKPRCPHVWLAASILAVANPGSAQVLISEILYHPVERAAFDTNGVPVLDLTDDIHEFVELHNTNSAFVALAGWRLSGGIAYEFPAGAGIAAGGFAVVARDPGRLAQVAGYGLASNAVFGPYSGQLGNAGDTIRLRNAGDELVDSVAYSPDFPWAIGANALGADDEWTGLNSSNFQYRGRSLERVSFVHSPNDPANWLASSLSVGPTPGRTNTVRGDVPLPIVIQLAAVQAVDGALIIRSNQPVRIEATFSSTNLLSNLLVEYFVDDINVTNEARSTVAMSPLVLPVDGRYAAVLPSRPDRTVVRYRIRGDRGAGLETVSPRADDPMAWHAYFVSRVRASANPVYDVFISSASLSRLASNIGQSPRRVTLPDPPGLPRGSWNATEPAIFVHEGVVYDIRMRHHGSRYNRSAGRKSYKFQFPEFSRFNGRTSYFETDKGDEHRLGSRIYEAVDFPAWRTRYVEIHLNSDAMDVALEQEELDKEAYRRWIDEQAAKYPDEPRQGLGETYKSTGVVPYETAVGQGTAGAYENSGEGPYYIGNAAPIPPKAGWSLNDRYAWTYGLQVDQWRGGSALRELITALWDVRGDLPTAPNPDLPAVREFLASRFDVEATLTYIAIRNWSAPFDNATHNHFLWLRGDGKWGMLPWDLDVEFGTARAGQSIFWDEHAVPQPDSLRGPQWVKDSFMKAFRDEYRQRAFILNNTLLSPPGLTAIGAGGLSAYAAARQPNVNTQLGFGPWHAPQRPTNVAPASAAVVFPPSQLRASPYLHSAPGVPPPHARTTWIVRRASGTYSNSVLRFTSATNLTSLAIPFERLVFGESYFWKCVYIDADNHPSMESVETSFAYGASPSPGDVQLSEVLADNSGSVLNGSHAPDFIEIVNVTAAPRDLSQTSLSDDPAVPGKFQFPPGTTLAGNARLVVWCDRATNAPGLHAGFQLDNDGQTVLLFAVTNGAYVLADAVVFGLQIPGRSIGRTGGVWVLADPTPGLVNSPAGVASPAALRINEWMASSTTGPDWFEIFNPQVLPVALGGLYLGDSPAQRTNTRIAALSYIAPGGYRRFYADDAGEGDGARHVGFRLGASGDSILLSAADATGIDAVTFGPQAADVSQGRLPDGAATVAAFPGSDSPEAPNHLSIAGIVINELVPDIELHNAGGVPVDIGGWWLSDDALVPQKYAIPAGTILNAGGYWSVDDDELPFRLDPIRGGRVWLSHDGPVSTDARYGPYDGQTYGTVATSVGVDFVRLAAVTFGSANAGPVVGPVVVSEIQYHPPDLPGDDDDYEFIELANITGSPANLFLPGFPEIPWRLRDAVSFVFPNGTMLAPEERVLVVGFDPSTNSLVRSNFLAAHDIPAGTRLFGPYAGKLDNSGASVELVAPQLPVAVPGPDFGLVPEMLLERVNYGDRFPWPSEADGAGPSLQRRALASYGNEPLNWLASGVSPGSATASNQAPTLTMVSPVSGAVFPFNQSIPVTALAADADGVIRRVEFLVDDSKFAEDDTAPYVGVWTNAAAGPHVLRARAIDNRLGIVFSSPVAVTVSNSAPQVALTSPADGAFIRLPTNILIEATATDLDGVVTRVEFLANGARLGEDASAPYSFLWQNPRSGAYTLAARAMDDAGAASDSPGVSIVAAREITIAYVVETNTVGSQTLPNPYGLGMDFNILSPVIVTHVGCFDSGGDGISASSTLTTQIFNRNGATPVVVAGASFSAADPGVLTGGSRFKLLGVPVLLTNGSYCVVGYGYDGNNRNGNIGTGNAKSWTTDDGGGLLAFVGGSRYGAVAPGSFPGTVDAGPADRYAAGTFQFRRPTAEPTILAGPANVLVRPGGTTNLNVLAIGDAPLRYQWSFKGLELPQATNASLTLVGVQATNEGAYHVVVTNSLGKAVSAPATLSLLLNPGFVIRPFDQLVVSNGSFTVSVVITGAPPPFRYEWREGSTVRGLTNSDERTNFFTYGPITNLAARQWRLIVTNAASLAPGINTTFNLTALADSDVDGLPDSWETAFGLSPLNAADRAADNDGDGHLNWEEYQAGTIPTDAGSYLKIDAIGVGAGATLTFGVLSNRTYTVQFSDGPGGVWSRLADVEAHPTNRVGTVADPEFTTRRFYRLATPSLR